MSYLYAISFPINGNAICISEAHISNFYEAFPNFPN